jgi:DNA-binding GntR family transcriptional regulator
MATLPDSANDAALTERVADAIHARVISGEMPAGSWLRQSQLAEEFDVSRTPIRAALQALSERGVLELIPNRGARIRLPTRRELQESYAVRAALEGMAAAQAADLASQAQLDRMLAAESLFEHAVTEFGGGGRPTRRRAQAARAGEPWHEANDEFHTAIHEAAHNGVLTSTIRTLHQRFPRNLTWGVLGDLRLLTENVAQHRAIREAIERRDAEAARTLMQSHVQRSGELLATRLTALPD